MPQPLELQTLFLAFAKLCERKLPSALSLRLVGVTPKPDGALMVSFQDAKGRAFEVYWLEKESSREELLPGNVGLYHVTSNGQALEHSSRLALALRDAVDDAAMLCMQSPRFTLLHFMNRHTREFPFSGDGLEQAFSSRFSTDDRSFAGFRWIQSKMASADRYVLSFQHPDQAQKLRVSFSPLSTQTDDKQGLVCGPFRVSFDWLVRGERIAEAHSLEELSALTGAPGQAAAIILFLVSRSFLPDASLSVDNAIGSERCPEGCEEDSSLYNRDEGSLSGEEEKWRTFVSIPSLEHGLTNFWVHSNAAIQVFHGENECRRIDAVGKGRTHIHHTLFNKDSSWVDRHGLSTNLTDADWVMGTLPRLDALLKEIAGRDKPTELVTLIGSCASQALGEDLEATSRRFQKQSGTPLLNYESTSLHSSTENYVGILSKLRDIVLHQDGPSPVKARHGLALFGYDPDPTLNELTGMLGQLGIPLVASVLPGISLSAMRSLLHAEVVVVNTFRPWREMIGQLLQDEDQTILWPSLPYGPQRSRDWLLMIADAFAVKDRCFERLQTLPFDEPPLLKTEDRDGAILIVDDAFWSQTEQACNVYGVPLLPLLAELGLTIDVFLYQAHAHSEDETAFQELPSCRVQRFSDAAGLAASLRECSSRLVFCGYAGDKRLSSLGKTGFFLHDFYPGFQGYRQTVKRFQSRLSMQGLSRWGRFVHEEGWSDVL